MRSCCGRRCWRRPGGPRGARGQCARLRVPHWHTRSMALVRSGGTWTSPFPLLIPLPLLSADPAKLEGQSFSRKHFLRPSWRGLRGFESDVVTVSNVTSAVGTLSRGGTGLGWGWLTLGARVRDGKRLRDVGKGGLGGLEYGWLERTGVGWGYIATQLCWVVLRCALCLLADELTSPWSRSGAIRDLLRWTGYAE